MKKTALILALLLTTTLYGQKIKVACIGNSITYGSGVENREQNSYPATLGFMLGDDYKVENLGVSGTTLSSTGDIPYVKTEQYKKAMALNPDIVLIKLGTNDSKIQNNKKAQEYINDYNALIKSLKTLPSSPRIIVLTPAKCFIPSGDGINDKFITSTIIPVAEAVAYENNLEIINLHNLFGDIQQTHIIPDKVHPSSIGMSIIAKKIYDVITFSGTQSDVITRIGLPVKREFNYHGYRGYEIDNNGVSCYVVAPKVCAPTKPWLQRARFWGHEPQTDIALLENGFHITYCDVADLFGNKEAVERWNNFYSLTQKAGLNPKVAIEAMSRGGLIAYNWAVENTEKVAAIYADAPVMDFKSWPMGLGKSDGSSADSTALMKVYNFTSLDQAIAYKGNPIDHAKKIAEANIPLIHVVGDIDKVVPVCENTEVFEKEVRKYGGNITVIHKADCDHHPHSLYNPKPIVDFILKATGTYNNECVFAAPGSEYRLGAGWIEGSSWHNVAQEISDVLQSKKVDVLFLGNSITQAMGGSRKRLTSRAGETALKQAIGDSWENCGISGDRTQNLLWRIENGKYNSATPKHIFITIGINNLSGGDDADDCAEGIIAVTKAAIEEFPQAKITLFGVIPAGKENNSQIRKSCKRVEEILSQTKFVSNVSYVSPWNIFTDKNGNLKTELYTNDYLHLSTKGYQSWSKAIAEILKR